MGTGRVLVWRRVWGRQVPWERLPPHSFLLTFPLVGTPARRLPVGQAGVPCFGPQTSAQRRAPPAQVLLSAQCQYARPTGALTGGGWSGSPSFACWSPRGAGVQTPVEVEGSHGAPSPAQHTHPERGLQPGAGGPGSVPVTWAVCPLGLCRPRWATVRLCRVYFDVVCVGAFAFLWALFV